MGHKLKQMMDVLVFAAAAAMLVAAAVGTSAASATPEFKTSGSFPVEFLGEGLGKSTFLSPELNSISCNNSHSKGSVVNSALATVTITYLNSCELVVEKSSLGKFKEACPNITTKELDILPVSKIGGGTKLGLLVQPKTGTELANFTCSGSNKVNVKVKGGVICESTPGGKLVLEGKVICKEGAKHGEQQFTTGTSKSGSVTSSLIAESTLSIFKITEKDAQVTTEDVTYAKTVEQVE